MKPRPNAPCPCGSGRKFKKCHGAAGADAMHADARAPGISGWMQRGAQIELLRALELEPNLAGAWGNLGNIEKYLGRFPRALECYRRAIEAETDSPQRYSETPIRLPHSRLCYTPVAYSPPVAPMPNLGGAPFTFGSFNRQDKLHPPRYQVWAEILEAVPDARLLLKNRALQIESVRDGVIEHFAKLGIARDRLLLRRPTDHATMLGEYRDVDIALDTFPYNGGLTTCECLWMGVPIVALEAERMIGRQTSAMLRLLGLDDWVATSTADYVRLAVAKRRQVDAAARLRATLRQRFAESPICDAARFARGLEAAFRAMWQRHCSGADAR